MNANLKIQKFREFNFPHFYIIKNFLFPYPIKNISRGVVDKAEDCKVTGSIPARVQLFFGDYMQER